MAPCEDEEEDEEVEEVEGTRGRKTLEKRGLGECAITVCTHP
jgi:hypothetical protein